MHDMLHLMKNARNNLLSYDFIIDGKVVLFQHIKELYDLEQKSVLRLVPKLTKAHVELNNFKKMNVRLATQVLSRSVGVVIQSYIKFEKMPNEAVETARFVERIDRLFDIMNSHSPSANRKWSKPLTLRSIEQFKELEDAVGWIDSWKFKSTKTGKTKDSLPFKEGLLLTVTSMREVCQELLSQYGFWYVLAARFNQDIVENWFSIIRSKGHDTLLSYMCLSQQFISQGY